MKREPLLEADFRRLILNRKKSARWAEGFKEASALVEAKITSGELRAVKSYTMTYHHDEVSETGYETPVSYHEGCPGGALSELHGGANFCPDCGAQIMKK